MGKAENGSEAVSRTTPLATLFPDNWQDDPDWKTVSPPGMKSAWLRRLSWKSKDQNLSALLGFLQSDGKETALDDKLWHKKLVNLISHQTCRQFFFLLIYPHLSNPVFMEKLRLLPDTEKLFSKWKSEWDCDTELTEKIENFCAEKQLKKITEFRGISISEAMTYPSFQAICAQKKGQHIHDK